MPQFKAHLVPGDQKVRPNGGPPQWVKYHPLEREARRALGLTRKVGRRLHYQMVQMEVAEKDAGTPEGSLGLPSDEWRGQFDQYIRALLGLITENRRFLALRLEDAAKDESEDSEELIGAVSLLTEEELRIALERRSKMS